jgi:hypothetical protein
MINSCFSIYRVKRFIGRIIEKQLKIETGNCHQIRRNLAEFPNVGPEVQQRTAGLMDGAEWVHRLNQSIAAMHHILGQEARRK